MDSHRKYVGLPDGITIYIKYDIYACIYICIQNILLREMVLNMKDKRFIVFQKEWLQLPAPSQYREMIWNANVFVCFWNKECITRLDPGLSLFSIS